MGCFHHAEPGQRCTAAFRRVKEHFFRPIKNFHLSCTSAKQVKKPEEAPRSPYTVPLIGIKSLASDLHLFVRQVSHSDPQL